MQDLDLSIGKSRPRRTVLTAVCAGARLEHSFVWLRKTRVQQVRELPRTTSQPRGFDRIGTDQLHRALHEPREEILEVRVPRGQLGDRELHAIVRDFAFALARRLRVVRPPDLSEGFGDLADLPRIDEAFAGTIDECPGCRLLAEIEVR